MRCACVGISSAVHACQGGTFRGEVIDLAWLLAGYRLSVQGTATVGGRSELRIVVARPSPVPRQRLQPGVWAAGDQVEVIVDAELGIALRQVWSWHGRAVLYSELTGVTTDIDPDAFTLRPPPGARIIHGGQLRPAGRHERHGRVPCRRAPKAVAALIVQLGVLVVCPRANT